MVVSILATRFRQILSKKSKLPVSTENWHLEFEYEEFSGEHDLFCFRPEVSFVFGNLFRKLKLFVKLKFKGISDLRKTINHHRILHIQLICRIRW